MAFGFEIQSMINAGLEQEDCYSECCLASVVYDNDGHYYCTECCKECTYTEWIYRSESIDDIKANMELLYRLVNKLLNVYKKIR